MIVSFWLLGVGDLVFYGELEWPSHSVWLVPGSELDA